MSSFIQVPPDSTGKKVYHVSHSLDGNVVYGQAIHLADNDSPENILHVDHLGAASVTFAEGQPTLDVFGRIRTGESTIVAGYEFSLSDMNDLFWDTTRGGGQIVRNVTQSMINLSVDSQSGSYASRTSNRYHYYQPGLAKFIQLAVLVGDTGKQNNIRRWGYFDDDNGLFFQLSGSALQVVRRSNTTGTVVDTVVNRNNWNGDKVDGTTITSLNLDVSKLNLYFIDFAWQGIGVVRFGIVRPEGGRVVLHSFLNANELVTPWARTGTLPVKMENVNFGVTPSTSELKASCIVVYDDSRNDYTFWRFGDLEVYNKVVTDDTPILSVRSKTIYEGRVNRINAYPEKLSVLLQGGPAKVELSWDVELSGSTWALASEGMLEADGAATSYEYGSTGYTGRSWLLSEGSHDIDLTGYFETNDEGILLSADGVTQPTVTFSATKLTSAPVSCSMILNYKELR